MLAQRWGDVVEMYTLPTKNCICDASNKNLPWNGMEKDTIAIWRRAL